ncbi:MFS transporter [Paenibacillus thermotolerans]|uniref:MFS transporter n=1 Tax=Paenibacillus thermotolerans TaxID=3027807 RepID=UPI00236752D8|nr:MULTISPECIES: MFS transporter [unclassified Paenibacillus]
MPHAKDRIKGRLDGQTRLLLLVQALFGLANALSGAFVNVYIWKAKQDYALIGGFALSNQVAMAVTFWLAGKWVKEHNKMNSLRLGVALSGVFYLLVLWLGAKAADWIIALGAIQGMSGAFFWLAFNIVYFEVTNPDNRDEFNGWGGLLGSGIGMIAPWVSGFLITRMPDTAGYRVIFSISLGIFVIGAIVSFFLKKRPVQKRYEWLYGINHLREKGSGWRSAFPALISQGVREGVFGFLIGLLVYIATKNELLLGNYALITSAVSLGAYYVAGKLIKPKRRSKLMLLGASAMSAVIVPFFWDVNYTTLLIFGIAAALFYPLFSIPITSSVFDLIGSNEESANHRVEYVILRETGLNIGRIGGTILFIVLVSFTTKPIAIVSYMMFIGTASIVSWLFLRRLLGRSMPRTES